MLDRRGRSRTTGAPFFLCIFLVALEQLDRDALRAADEADADSRPNGCRLLRELHTLGLDLGGHRINVFYRQPEMIEPLIGRLRRCVDAVAGRDRRDEYVGTAELDVDPPGAPDDYAAEDIFKPSRSRFRVGTAQVDMIPGDYRHRRSPRLSFMRPLPRDLRPAAARSILAVAFWRCHPSMADLVRTALCAQFSFSCVRMQPFRVSSIDRPRRNHATCSRGRALAGRYGAVQQAICARRLLMAWQWALGYIALERPACRGSPGSSAAIRQRQRKPPLNIYHQSLSGSRSS